MRDRMVGGDPRRTGPERRRPDPAHEKEVREREPRVLARARPLTFRERSERALADVGIYCLVPFVELAEAHFGGRHRAARRAVNTWIREGLAREFAGKDAGGTPYALFTSTAKGASVLRDLAEGLGIDPGQRFTYTLKIRREQFAHDSAVYRAARREHEQLARGGARVRRVRLERELSGTVFGRSEAARHRLGRRAAEAERHRAATELGLPVDPAGRVLLPDAQVEYVDAAGRSGRVNVEVASDHYGAQHLGPKVQAGFRVHASGPRATRVLASLRSGGTEL
ncbi:MAG: hypothetical protein OYL41_02305 [Acidobacteriota bacterium]|nr:hypothetical protein [Acidobacteriota bacterium]